MRGEQVTDDAELLPRSCTSNAQFTWSELPSSIQCIYTRKYKMIIQKAQSSSLSTTQRSGEYTHSALRFPLQTAREDQHISSTPTPGYAEFPRNSSETLPKIHPPTDLFTLLSLLYNVHGDMVIPARWPECGRIQHKHFAVASRKSCIGTWDILCSFSFLFYYYNSTTEWVLTMTNFSLLI